MSKPVSFGKLEINLVSSMEEACSLPKEKASFCIALLGDFSGRSNRGLHETGVQLVQRKPVMVDRDNIDKVVARFNGELKLSILKKNSAPVQISLSELEDFHPDHLFQKLEIFQALKDMRKSVNDPSMFASLAQKFIPSHREEEESESEKIAMEGTSDLLDRIIGESEEKPVSGTCRGTSAWDAFLQRIVSPHLVPNIESRQKEMAASVDAAVSELMRIILHHPDFQTVESAWRGLHFLVSRLETGEELKLYIIDVSKAELSADLLSTEDLRFTGIYKLLVEQTIETPGSDPWALLAGIYTFDKTSQDAELLGRLAKIAKAAGAPFITAVHERLIGCEALAEAPDPDDWKYQADAEINQTWQALRGLPEASYLGLCLPRFLLRLPYGSQTDPSDLFDFEEMEESPEHNRYLWGNPSFAVVYLLGAAFNKYGRNFQPGLIQDIESLPLHVYKEQGESLVKPCAEVVLTERAAEYILDKGVMPLLSFRDQDTIRLARFQSFSDPPAALAGQWSKEP